MGEIIHLAFCKGKFGNKGKWKRRKLPGQHKQQKLIMLCENYASRILYTEIVICVLKQRGTLYLKHICDGQEKRSPFEKE